MARKVFQIAFILLIILAFGTVFNHYLKHKLSDPDDYLNYIETFPQQRISRIDPIIIGFAQDFNKTEYPLNVPIKDKIIRISPSVKGTLYWSDTKTLEFYPDEPLQSNNSYIISVDLNKVFKSNDKIKDFRFQLNTFKQQLFVEINGFTPIDSSLTKQTLSGNILFNDYIDIDEVNSLFSAKQSGKSLAFAIQPGLAKNNFVFRVENISRYEKQDTLVISWKHNKLNLKGSKIITIPGLNSFFVNETAFIDDTVPRLVIQFSDPLFVNRTLLQNIHIHGATADSFRISQKSIVAYFNDSCPEKIYLHIDDQLKNTRNITLNEPYSQFLNLEKDEAGIALNDSSFIMAEIPDNLHWTFKAKKLKGVDIQIIKIYENNILQFLQANSMQEINQLDRVGTVVYQQSVNLTDYLQYNPLKWTSYSLNINDFIPEQGCIYSLLLSYRNEQNSDNKSITYERKDWNKYYSDFIIQENSHQAIHQNLYYSTLSIFSKITQNDSLYVWINDVASGLPQKEVKVEVLNYQFQTIARSKTNTEGMSRIKLNEQPCFISALFNGKRTFLKIGLSNYQTPPKNTTGFFFQQNKIWQANDTLQVAFISNNIFNKALPPTLSFNITDRHKKKLYTRMVPSTKQGLYTFKYIIPNNLNPESYFIEVKLHNETYSTSFQVVKPDYRPNDFTFELQENTLNDISYAINTSLKNSPFDTCQQVIFLTTKYEPLADIYSPSTIRIYPTPVETIDTFMFTPDLNGDMLITIHKNKDYNNYKVYHNFEITYLNHDHNTSRYFNFTVPSSEALLRISKLNQSVNSKFKIDKNGLTLPIKLTLFVISTQNDSIILEQKTINSNENSILYTPEIPLQPFLKYCLKAQSGLTEFNYPFYCCSDNPFVQYSGSKPGLKLLTDSTPIYMGDSLKFMVQSTTAQKVLIILENHHGVLFQKNQTILAGQAKISIKGNKDWEPSVMLSIYAIHDGQYSDPIRHEFEIKKNNALLQPVIFAPHETQAETKMIFSIKESSQLGFNYVIAIYPVEAETEANLFPNFVKGCYRYSGFDIGLRNNLSFYRNTISYLEKNSPNHLTTSPFNRFEYYLGPYTLNEHDINNHELDIPQFIGDMEIKIIAYNQNMNVYAENKHRVSVHKSLMIMAHSPKSIAPNEQISFPIKVYSSRNEKRPAQITLNNVNDLNIIDSISKNILINKLMTETTYFNLSAKQRNGLGQFEICVNDSAYWAEKTINIPVKSNSITIFKNESKKIDPDEKWQTRFTPIGIKGTNSACIESSAYGQIHLNQLIQKLINNKHDDLDHLISSAYPLLYLKDLTQISPQFEDQINTLINTTLNQLIYYQSVNGGFTLWTSDTEINPWLSTYAGYFMLEARKKGFTINLAVYNKWLRYQRRACLVWSSTDNVTDLTQCFGLYTLALAGIPDFNSMNKLVDRNIYTTSRLFLAMAFYLSDKNKTGQQLLPKKPLFKSDYNQVTFGDQMRDMAICADAYRLYHDQFRSDSLLHQIINKLETDEELNAQSVAFSIASFGKFINLMRVPYQKISYTINKSTNQEFESNKAIAMIDIPIEFTLSQTVDIKNESKLSLFMSIDYYGKPESLSLKKSGIEIDANVNLLDYNGNYLPINALHLNDKIFAKITIVDKNNNLKNESCFIEFPIANCFEIDGDIIVKSAEMDNIKVTDSEVIVYFTQVITNTEILIPLKCTYKGVYKQAPLTISHLFNPIFQSVINGFTYEVK